MMQDKPRQMIGAKGGGGGSSFITKPDSLRSNDSFEILLGLGSGRWKGLVNGLESFKINGVPLENEDGTSNFENVFLIFADGNPLENQIVNFTLGGGGNSQTVNTTLANANPSAPGGWVSGAVFTPNANFIDLRFIAQQLFRQDKKSIGEATATIEIEMRPSGSPTWVNIFAAPTSNSTVYNPQGYDYIEDYGGYTGRIYLGRELFNPSGIGFAAGNGQGMSITGKTSSAFVKEIRVAVPNTGTYANKTWEVRARLVEKDSVDAGDIQERRTIVFETITAVITTPLGDDPEWDGLVWAKVHGKASDQFNGFPEMAGIFDTKICKVPPGSVFNPDTRAYTNITWDGSYVEAFTTDPAWQIKEFVEDPIHGLAGLIPGSTLDKWDALEASKYFSELVPDGQGGFHPRFSMNYTINEAKEVDEQMQFLAGAVNSYTEDIGGGVWRFKVDKPETPIMLFTEDNIFGEFTYGHSPIDSRFNDWRGTFLDETLDYETNTVRVFDQPDIDANGTKFTEVALIGCSHPQEALRRLMFRLRVSLNEYKMVNFSTNRVGRLISPLDTILVADGALNPSHLIKSTSRLHSYAGSNVVLKRAVRLQSGVTYKMKFTTTDLQVVERTVTNSSGLPGDIIAITLNSALPNNIMPDSAVALEAVGLAALPVAYRVVGVERSEDNEDEYNISAVMIDVGKWDAMDNVDADVINAQESVISIGPPTEPDDGVFNVVEYVAEFQVKRVLQVNWNRPSSMFLDGFRFEWRLNDGQWRIGSELLKDSIFELQNPEDGKYEVKITALDRRGVQSNPLIASYVFDGSAQVTPPAHDRGEVGDRPTVGLYNGHRFTATDTNPPVTFVWDAALNLWVPEVNLVTEGSQIGVENGATVGMTPTQAALLAAAEAAIADLFATYGDTASASAAAVAAEAAKNDAIDAADAAGGYATTASTKRDEASGFASASAASALIAKAAQAGKGLTLNAEFSEGITSWTNAANQNLPYTTPTAFVPVTNYQGAAHAIQTSATRAAAGSVTPIDTTRKYRLRARYYTTGTGTIHVGTSFYDAASVFVNEVSHHLTTTPALNTWVTVNVLLNGPTLAAYQQMAPFFLANWGSGTTALTTLDYLYIEDVTESESAANSAFIADSSAVAADNSATSAATQASLSATYSSNARRAAANSFPTTFDDRSFWTGDADAANPSGAGTDVTYGAYYTNPSAATYHVIGRLGRVASAAGRRWKVRALVAHVSGTPTTVRLRAETYNSSVNGSAGRTGVSLDTSTAVISSTTPIWVEDWFIADAAPFIKPAVVINYPSTTAVQRLYALEMIDITESQTATAQADIAIIQAVAATNAASAANTSQTLSVAYSQTRGQTPNADFKEGMGLWYSTAGAAGPPVTGVWVANDGGALGCWENTVGLPSNVYSSLLPIDPINRKYKIRGRVYSSAATGTIYVGASSHDANGATIGTNTGHNYITGWAGVTKAAGWHDIESQVLTGVGGSADIGSWFRLGTKQVRICAFLNYNAAGGHYFALDSLWLEDVTDSELATSQAGVAIAQAAIATSNAAAAQTSALLSASMGKGYLNPNANFAAWPSASGNPLGWSVWGGAAFGGGGDNIRYDMSALGYNGNQRPELSDWGYGSNPAAAGNDVGLQFEHDIPVTPGVNKFIIEASARLYSGPWNGAGVLLYCFNASGVYIGADYLRFWTDPDTTGTVSTSTLGLRKWSKQVTAIAGTYFVRLYAMGNWAGFPTASVAAKSVGFLNVGIKQQDAVGAQVETQAAVLATHTTKLASWVTRVSAGVGTAEVSMTALDSGGSVATSIGIRADKIILGSMTQAVLEISSGVATFGSDVYINNGKLVVDTGTHMKIIGKGFGTTNQFIEWFGPKMAFNLCSEANAVSYLKTNGQAYFGGAITAGTYSNAIRTTSIASNAEVTTGTFGSAGGPRTVALSYTYHSESVILGACPVSPTMTATIQLYRGTNASGTLLTTLNITTGDFNCAPGAGPSEPGAWTVNAAGSLTYTDNSGGLTSSYFARLTARTMPDDVNTQQSISIVSVE